MEDNNKFESLKLPDFIEFEERYYEKDRFFKFKKDASFTYEEIKDFLCDVMQIERLCEFKGFDIQQLKLLTYMSLEFHPWQFKALVQSEPDENYPLYNISWVEG